MKKIEAIQILQQTKKKIFKAPDLKKLLNLKKTDAFNKQIKGLIEAGVLARIVRGYYYLVSNKPLSFELANVLCQPSYISLESALNYYGILIQTPQQITSVTTKLTAHIENAGSHFFYAHLDQKYFSDYQKVDNFLMATPEKALIDMMFFVALGRASLSVEELNLQIINKNKVKELAVKIKNQAFKNYFKTVKL